MKTSFNILVATDYSKIGGNAERYAVEFARSTGSTVTFLHIFEESIGFPQELVAMERMQDSPIEFETRRLHLHVEKLLESAGIPVPEVNYTCIVRKGNPTEEILKVSVEGKADFMIMGTHSANAFHKTFLGSHTWDIIKDVTIPVLAIPEEANFKNIQNIVFATEYRPSEIPLIKLFAGFAKAFNAELTVLHVTNNVFSVQFEREMFEKFTDEVKSKVDYDKLSIRLINNEDLVDGLNGFCIRANSNWLVMSHERTLALVGMFNPLSVTKRMSFSTHVPLFAIPGNYAPTYELEAKLAVDISHEIG